MRLQHIADLETSDIWGRLWDRDPVQHPYYLPSELKCAATHFQPVYYLPEEAQYHQRVDTLIELVPQHVAVYDDTGPIMGMPITVERHEGYNRLSAYGRPLYLVWDEAVSESRARGAAKLIYNHLSQLAMEHHIDNYHLRDYLLQGGLSPISERLLRDGGHAIPYFTHTVSLKDRDLDDMRLAMRANFRRILRQRAGKLDARIVTGDDVEPYHTEMMHKLHVAMRGREVRTLDYWRAAMDCVRSGAGFLVIGAEDGVDIAAAYFPCSQRYCYYSAAAHDPLRLGIGLDHVLLWRAIEHAKEVGCDQFELGDRVYPGQHPHVAPKLHSISDFKAGFGPTVAIRMDILAAPPGVRK